MSAPPPKPTKTFDFSAAVPAGVSVRRKGKAMHMNAKGMVVIAPPDTQRIDDAVMILDATAGMTYYQWHEIT
jgi:23S rRNA A2030 N6-methylase RlmJ